MAALTLAALTNCGRAPTTVTIFISVAGKAGEEWHDPVWGAQTENSFCFEGHTPRQNRNILARGLDRGRVPPVVGMRFPPESSAVARWRLGIMRAPPSSEAL